MTSTLVSETRGRHTINTLDTTSLPGDLRRDTRDFLVSAEGVLIPESGRDKPWEEPSTSTGGGTGGREPYDTLHPVRPSHLRGRQVPVGSGRPFDCSSDREVRRSLSVIRFIRLTTPTLNL